jgi:hypothetical protein
MERQCWGCLAAEDEKMLARVVPANEAVRGKMGRGYNGKMIWCIITARRDQRRHTDRLFHDEVRDRSKCRAGFEIVSHGNVKRGDAGGC